MVTALRVRSSFRLPLAEPWLIEREATISSTAARDWVVGSVFAGVVVSTGSPLGSKQNQTCQPEVKQDLGKVANWDSKKR